MEGDHATPMEVDAPATKTGHQLYAELALEMLRGLDLVVPDTNLLRPESQLLVYHHAARLFDLREAILALWREEPTELPEPYRLAAQTVKARGQLPPNSELKAKKVFGHPAAIKFLKLPILPETATGCIFLQQRPHVAANASAKTPWTFAQGQYTDPIGDLEANRSVLVMHMDSFLKGALVIASPVLQTGEALALGSAPEALAQMVSKDSESWRRLLKTEHDLFSQATASLMRQVLKLGPVAVSSSTVTPKKKTGDASVESPVKEANPAKDATLPGSKSDQDGAQCAYGKLLEAMLQELGYFTDLFQGLRWLDNKKQLLVYYHAAQLSEKRDAVLAAMRGAPSEVELHPAYADAVGKVRDELTESFAAEGQKLKKIFSHDHVIRFHSLKGVPVPRSCCIFLRERPQCSSDILRKTPSIFRDLVRYRNQGSPLMELEHHQLALVLTVQDRNPRAFVVISPLFEKPSVVEQVCRGSWSDIQEALKDELASLIRKESDAWRAFIQRHADVVSKDSLKIIQKVLKTCQPGSGLGEFTMRFAEDVEEANQARELAEMRYAEAEQRWDMEAQLALADADIRRRDAEKKAGQQASAAERAKLRAKSQAAKAKEQAAEMVEEERQATQESFKAQLAAQHTELANLRQEYEQANAARARLEIVASQREEEVQALEDAKQELLLAISKMDSLCHTETQTWRTKNAVLKQHIKQSKKEHKEQCTKAAEEARAACNESLKAAEAKFLEVQTATLDEQHKLIKEADAEVSSARREAATASTARAAAEAQATEAAAKAAKAEAQAADAQAAERRASAALEVQTATLQRTSESNAALRVEAAEARASLSAAQQEALAATAKECSARAELETRTKELRSARSTVDQLQAEVDGEQKKYCALERDLDSAKAAADTLTSDLRSSRAETQASRDEAATLATSCTQLRAEAAKVPLLKEEMRRLEQQLDEVSKVAARAEQLQGKVVQLQAELANTTEVLSQTQESNKALRLQAAEAREAQDGASQKILELQKQLSAEKEVRASLAAVENALQVANAQCEVAEARAQRAQAETKEAQEAAADMAKRAEIAEEAQRALQKNETSIKAELAAQIQQASHLTEKCASLTASALSASGRADAATAEAATADQAARAKEAQNEILQKSLEAVQASNMSLRAEAKQAQQETVSAKSACDAAEHRRSKAEEEAARAVEAAKKAEAKALQDSAGLIKLEKEHTLATEKLAEMQKLVDGAEEKIALSQVGERKAKSQLSAQASEASRLSALCAQLRFDLEAAEAKASACERRAVQAEAERTVALASSELREDDVRRIAASGPRKLATATPLEEDRLVEELEALLEESPESPAARGPDSAKGAPEPAAGLSADDKASSPLKKRQRRSTGHGADSVEKVQATPAAETVATSGRCAAPSHRIRGKSIGRAAN